MFNKHDVGGAVTARLREEILVLIHILDVIILWTVPKNYTTCLVRNFEWQW